MIDAAVWWKALLLGIVQGLTEFLPVSSSGHLVLVRTWFGMEEAGVTFDVLLHLGTMLAIAIVFWRELLTLIRSAFRFVIGRSDPEERQRVFAIALGLLPVAVIGFLVKDAIDAAFTSGRFAGAMLLVTAVILVIGHRFRGATGEVTPRRGLIIGLFQVFAILPGISRSGTTIATGMVAGVNPQSAARFSFLMAVPLFLAAAVLEAPKLAALEATMPAGALALGFVASFVSGILAIRWLLTLLAKGKFVYFAVYCAALGLVALFTT